MNKYRGDVTLNPHDQPITLRPSFTALAQIEQQTGQSLIALARRLANGESTLAEVKSIINASSTSASPQDYLEGVPLLDIHETLLDFLVSALTGDTNHA